MPAGPPPTMQQRTLFVRFGCWSDVIAAAIHDVSIDQDMPDDCNAGSGRSQPQSGRVSARTAGSFGSRRPSRPRNKPRAPLLWGIRPKRHQRERSTWHGCLQAWQPGWPSTSRSSICARGEAAMRKRASRRSSFACGDGRARLSLSRQSSRLPLARQRERPALRGPFMQQSQIISDLHCWSRSPECRSAIRSARDQHQRSAQLAPLSATCRSQSATERSDCSDLCWC